jgi:hypothetical protein
LQIRQAVAKRVIFEYRSRAYLKVREHRNADKLLFAARHHEFATVVQLSARIITGS